MMHSIQMQHLFGERVRNIVELQILFVFVVTIHKALQYVKQHPAYSCVALAAQLVECSPGLQSVVGSNPT